MHVFLQYIKSHFQRSHNGLMQVILLHALCFSVLRLLKIGLTMAGHAVAYTTFFHYLALPAAWPTYLRHPWTLLTHLWWPMSFFSTLLNLGLLHTFGQVVMRCLGSRHFIALYLLGGLAGGSLFLLLCHVAPYFRGTATYLIGFSGSLYAVMVAAATLAPQRSLSLIFLGPFALKHLVGFLVLFALINLVGTESAANIARLGGALLGYIYAKGYYGGTWRRSDWVRCEKPSNNLKVTYRRHASLVKHGHDTPLHTKLV